MTKAFSPTSDLKDYTQVVSSGIVVDTDGRVALVSKLEQINFSNDTVFVSVVRKASKMFFKLSC